MSTFAMFCVAIAIAVFHARNVNGMKDFDIENVYEHLGQLHKKGFSVQRRLEYQSLEREENTGDEFLQLIQNIARSPQVEMGLPYRKNNVIINESDRRNKHGQDRNWPWRYLYVKPPWLKSINTPRILNYLLNVPKKIEVVNNDLDDYSKIYLVIDSDVDITDSDVKELSNMVSSVLSEPNAQRKSAPKDHIQKERRYKGFVLSDNRRRIRDSKEMFDSKDSKEYNYKMKRPRGEYGVGGGRTAIPYIRHRGDIFESE